MLSCDAWPTACGRGSPRSPTCSRLPRPTCSPTSPPARAPPPLRSTNPQEWLNKELRRRTDVVGIFPTRTSLLRLVGMLLAEQDDEWAVGRAYFSAESMAQIDGPQAVGETLPELLMAS